MNMEIRAVPGINSMTNSTHRSGGMPGKSSGNTSGKSHTTCISCISGGDSPSIKQRRISGELGMTEDGGLDSADQYSTMSPEEVVMVMVLAAQSRLARYLASQFMPSMTSMPFDLRATTSKGKDD